MQKPIRPELKANIKNDSGEEKSKEELDQYPAQRFAGGAADPRAHTAIISRSHSNSPDPEITAPTANSAADCQPSFHQITIAPSTPRIATKRSGASASLQIVRRKSA